MGISDDVAKLFDATPAQQGFVYLKTLRDAVIHARLFSSGLGIGEAPGKKGKRPEEVLLTPEALEGLYQRLAILSSELANLEKIIHCQKMIAYSHLFGALDAQQKTENEQIIQAAADQCRSNQSRRLSLPPFPDFPDPPKVVQLLSDWLTFQGPKSISIDFPSK